MNARFSKAWASRTAKFFTGLIGLAWSMPIVNAAVHFQTLHTFEGPVAGLIQGTDGALYWTMTTSTNWAVFRIHADGTGYTILYSFAKAPFSCSFITIGPLLEGTDGALYGTSISGDILADSCPSPIFKLNKDGSNYTGIHIYADKVFAQSGLIDGTNGTLFGTTIRDGAYNNGTVFKVQKDGSGYTVIYDFEFNHEPQLSLRIGNVLYGATTTGGTFTNASGLSGLGTLFALNQDGSGYRVLHNFGVTGDGWYPKGGLTEGTDGALYGMTAYSGGYTRETGPMGGPTIFRLNKDGSSYTILHIFDPGVGGDESECTLAKGGDGRLYGTTPWGGADPAAGNVEGSVFRLNEDGTGYTNLYSFGSTLGDGAMPRFGVIRGQDGAFYGTTALWHGESGGGTLFKFWPPETPHVIGITTTNNSTQVTFGGVSGARYQILRSTELITWTVLDTITMPASGIYNFPDNSPTNSRAFYRAAWLP